MNDITAFLMGRNQDLVEKAGKVMRKLKEAVEEKGLKLSITENGKEDESKMIASCGHLEESLRECSRKEGVTMADSVERAVENGSGPCESVASASRGCCAHRKV